MPRFTGELVAGSDCSSGHASASASSGNPVASVRNGWPPAIRHVSPSIRSTKAGPVVISSPAVTRSRVRRADAPGAISAASGQGTRATGDRRPLDVDHAARVPGQPDDVPDPARLDGVAVERAVALGVQRQEPGRRGQLEMAERAVRGRLEQQRVPQPALADDRLAPPPAAPPFGDGPPDPVAGRRPARAGSPDEPGARPVAQEPTPSAASDASQRSDAERSSPGQPGRHPPGHPDVPVAVLEVHRAALADPGQQLARRVRHRDVDVLPQRRQERRDLGPQRVEPEARRRGDEDLTRSPPAPASTRRRPGTGGRPC